MRLRSELAYRLFSLVGKLLPPDERKRLVRIIRLGAEAVENERRVPVSEVIIRRAECACWACADDATHDPEVPQLDDFCDRCSDARCDLAPINHERAL